MEWIRTTEPEPIDIEVLEESALAMAQATLYQAMKESGLKGADIARGMNRPRSFISRMLGGSHNLTVKTFARAMAACGFELRFEKRPIKWGWVAESTCVVPTRYEAPAYAGTSMITEIAVIGVPTDLNVLNAAVARQALAASRDHSEHLELGA